MMWFIIFFCVIGMAAAAAVYLTVCISRLGIIQKISGGKKRIKYPAAFAILAGVYAVFLFAMSGVNAIVVFLSAAMFFILTDIIAWIYRRCSGKAISGDAKGRCAFMLTAVYLAAGFYLCRNVWQTEYSISTDKDIGLKIAMIADSHIGTTFDGEGFAEHIKKIEAEAPDILIIAGDFVDDDSKRRDMLRACEALGKTSIKYGVWYAYGNHDRGYYHNRDFTAKELEAALRENNVHILEDEYALVDNSFYVVGRKDRSFGERKDINGLLNGVDTSKYIVVIDHQPNDYDNEAASAADLVLSGHTHGGQLLPIKYVGEWFGINDRTYGHEKRGNTDFIVTSGISDWAVKFKTGTRSEYVIVDVGG